VRGSGHPLDRLTAALELTEMEVDLIALAGLPEQHEGYAGVLRRLDAEGAPWPTAGLAAQLYAAAPADRAGLRELLESGAAVASGALVVEPGRPFFERSLRLAPGLWSALHGIPAWPTDATFTAPPRTPAGLTDWTTGAAAERAVRALERGLAATILVTADSAAVARDRGAALIGRARSGSRHLTLALPAEPERERVASLHALCHDVVPLVCATPAVAGGPPAAAPLALHPGPVVVCARPGDCVPSPDRPLLTVAAEPITRADGEDVWRAALPALGDEAAELAVLHRVEPGPAAAAGADVAALERLDARPATTADVVHALRARAGGSGAAGLRRVRAGATWDDLILPPERLEQLREALDRVVHRTTVIDDWGLLAGRPGARGVRMLFSGPPGTGKTLSAEVLASALGTDLLVADLSRLVSKWLGETERNLAAVFDAVESERAVLLFDEADALFGRRTEVTDARDRYANLETAYLLERLERFDGLTVLATNLRRNIDGAFARRLEFVVPFDDPGARERELLWRRHLGGGAPLAPDVDPAALAARYPVVGGLIRNAAVAAAFLAAAEQEPIRQAHLHRALRREYEKSGRAFPQPPTTSMSA
jgi:hypothetical protein